MRDLEEQRRLEENFQKCCLNKNGTPMYEFSEIYEHALFHGDGDWDFSEGGKDRMSPEDLIRVDWALLKKFTQEQKGEEAEEIDPDVKASTTQGEAYDYCKRYLMLQYGSSLGLPESDTLEWESLNERSSEETSEFTIQSVG